MLNEALTDVVFQHRSVQTVANILKNNRFMSSVAYGTPSDMTDNKGRLYYLSFARSPRGGYASYEKGNVVLTLDGRKLSQRYKGVPVDYWNFGFKRIAVGGGSDEMEDRLITNKPYIDDAASYITEIHISAPIDKPRWERAHIYHHSQWEAMKEISDEAKKYGIPTFFYPSVSSYRSMNRKLAFRSYEEWEKAVLADKGDYAAEIRPKQSSGSLSPYDWGRELRKMADILEHFLVNNGTKQELSKDEELYEFARDRLIGYRAEPVRIAKRIELEVHNNRKKEGARPEIVRIGKLLAKYKTDLVGLSQKLLYAWSNIELGAEKLQERKKTISEDFDKNKFPFPEPASQEAADDIFYGGFEDGLLKDDKIVIKKNAPFTCRQLNPSQSEVRISDSIELALWMLEGKFELGGNLGGIVSGDDFIMDGHHRWSGSWLAGGEETKITATQIMLPKDQLIPVLAAVGDFFHPGKRNPGADSSTPNIFTSPTSAIGDYIRRLVSEDGITKYMTKADAIRICEANGGVEKIVELFEERAEGIKKKSPIGKGLPPRNQMPVIRSGEVDAVTNALEKGQIDVMSPYTDKAK